MGDALHVEFPELTPEAEALLKDSEALLVTDIHWRRRYLAAGVRAANGRALGYCLALANSLHNPLPPPTLEEMLKALQELENWQQIEGEAIPAAGVSAGNRLEILRRGIAHHCKG